MKRILSFCLALVLCVSMLNGWTLVASARKYAVSGFVHDITEATKEFDNVIIDTKGWYWPAGKNGTKDITCFYGYRNINVAGSSKWHGGLDIGCVYSPVYASKAGVVVDIGETLPGYGNQVVIYHGKTAEGKNVYTSYSHLKWGGQVVSIGQRVEKGEKIATSGDTGIGVAHLDFAIGLGVYSAGRSTKEDMEKYYICPNPIKSQMDGNPFFDKSSSTDLEGDGNITYTFCVNDHEELGTKNYHTSSSGVLGACRECGEPYNWQDTFKKKSTQYYLKSGNSKYKVKIYKAPYEDAKCLSGNTTHKQLNVVGTITNAYGNTWYAVDYADDSTKTCYVAYVYSGELSKYTDSKPGSVSTSKLPAYEQPILTNTVVTAKKYEAGNSVTTTHKHDYTYNNGICRCGEKKVEQTAKSTLKINLTAYPESIKQGSSFGLRGTISSNYNIKKVKGYIKQGDTICDSSEDIPNSKSMDVGSAQLNYSLAFGKLPVGNYSLYVEAVDSSGQTKKVTKNFTVYEEKKKVESTLRINLERYPVSINVGSSFGLQGNISSNYTISKVLGYIYNANGSIVQSTTDTPNSTYLNIQPAKLNQRLIFGKLPAGNYTMKVEAIDSSGKVVTVTKTFSVKGRESNSSNSNQTTSQGQIISDGVYVIATKLNKNFVLDISGGSTDDGANLQLWENNGTPAQQFKVEHISNGYYQIVNVNSGKAVDVANGSKEAGANVWQYEINNTDAQLWKISSAGNGYYYIIGKGSGLFLDVSNAYAASGTNVGIFVKNDAYDAQKWILTKVSSSSNSSSPSSSSVSKPNASQNSTPVASSTSIRFEIESTPKGNLPYGKSFSLKGWFRSDSAIVEARAYILDENKNVVMQAGPASSTTSNYKIQGYKLDNGIKFGSLRPGGYYLKYYVRDADGDTATWISDKFYIVK